MSLPLYEGDTVIRRGTTSPPGQVVVGGAHTTLVAWAGPAGMTWANTTDLTRVRLGRAPLGGPPYQPLAAWAADVAAHIRSLHTSTYLGRIIADPSDIDTIAHDIATAIHELAGARHRPTPTPAHEVPLPGDAPHPHTIAWGADENACAICGGWPHDPRHEAHAQGLSHHPVPPLEDCPACGQLFFHHPLCPTLSGDQVCPGVPPPPTVAQEGQGHTQPGDNPESGPHTGAKGTDRDTD